MHQFSGHTSQKITLVTKKMTSNNVNTTHNIFWVSSHMNIAFTHAFTTHDTS
jgi:hypothetical protein